jgi:hypothetical protein
MNNDYNNNTKTKLHVMKKMLLFNGLDETKTSLFILYTWKIVTEIVEFRYQLKW